MSNEFVKQINRSIKSDDNLNDLEFEITKFQLLKKSNTLRTIIKSKEIIYYLKTKFNFILNNEISYGNNRINIFTNKFIN